MGVLVRDRPKGSGVWWVFVNDGGERRAKRVGDRKAANAVASEIRRRIAEGTFRLAPRGRLFEAVATEWQEQVAALRGVRVNTVENYTSIVTQHLIPYFGKMRVGEITTEHVEKFITAKLAPGGSTRNAERGLARVSLHPILTVLRMVLKKSVKAGELDRHPMDALDRQARNTTDNADPFTTDELQGLLDAAHAISPTAGAMFRLWAQTGLRAGEIAGLQQGDIDLERGTVTVSRTFSRRRLGPPKRGGARTVSMLHPITEATAEWRPGVTAESRAVAAALRRLPVVGVDPTRFLFGRDGLPMKMPDLYRLWKRMVVKSGVRYRVPEQLRHTFATTMLTRNAPLLYVQKQGGWSSATVMLKVYARWLPTPEAAVQLPATQAQPAKADRL